MLGNGIGKKKKKCRLKSPRCHHMASFVQSKIQNPKLLTDKSTHIGDTKTKEFRAFLFKKKKRPK